MSIYGRRNGGGASLALSGKDEAGRPLQGHMHVFYLPTDEDGDGQLDHLTVWDPAGLSAEEFRVGDVSVTEMNPGDGRAPVRLEYEAHGAADDFVEGCPVFARSRLWRSLTPYVPTRHVKRRNTRDKSGRRRVVDGPRDQIRREVSLRWPGGPELVATRQIDPLEPMAPMRSWRFTGVQATGVLQAQAGRFDRGWCVQLRAGVCRTGRRPRIAGIRLPLWTWRIRPGA